MFHIFSHSVAGVELPAKFTYPFHYTPHPLCVIAAGEVQQHISACYDFSSDGHKGKMFGVLVASDASGRLGYLAAFSGLLDGRSVQPYFVPPVYDLTTPDGYFRREEACISDINTRISAVQSGTDYREARARLAELRRQASVAIDEARRAMREAKAERDRRRNMELTDEEREDMVRQSQFLKAELKRTERHWAALTDDAEQHMVRLDAEVERLKTERKERSAALQDWLFRQFVMLNARGEGVALPELFADTPQGAPPAGAGECAAPKLLQYAYTHQLKPIAMAEFWWGASPRNEIRVHGEYYPACQGKCGPILRHMLLGLDVEPNPLQTIHSCPQGEVEVVYDDTWLMVVCKPHNMLTVPGRDGGESLFDIVSRMLPESSGPLIVHRLDMATSGLLLIAKDKETHAALQRQFEQRTVHKRYKAIVEGTGLPRYGEISLPLKPDYINRPRQTVDHEAGREAVTRYEVVRETTDGHTHVYFYPLTGRTHQLRVHSAHHEGLNAPIKGDTLYGHSADRLYLHAESITFTHPVTHEEMTIVRRADF
jgi:tRNA pseudouridine32 synthase/23S rRNA pseudouridine746 synthase